MIKLLIYVTYPLISIIIWNIEWIDIVYYFYNMFLYLFGDGFKERKWEGMGVLGSRWRVLVIDWDYRMWITCYRIYDLMEVLININLYLQQLK